MGLLVIRIFLVIFQLVQCVCSMCRFYFVTRVYNKYWEHVILPDLKGDPVPDVVIMNSCLWDVSRYGQCAHSMDPYKKNLETTFSRLNSILPMETLIMWNCALPVSKEARGGVLIPELQTLGTILGIEILAGNFYSKELAKFYDIDVLDLHFYFRKQMQRQAPDGIHWNYVAHRRITNLILAHIAVSWGVGCPRGRVPPAQQSPPQKDRMGTIGLYTDFDEAEAPVKKNKEVNPPPEPTTQTSGIKINENAGRVDGNSLDGSVKQGKEEQKPPSSNFEPPDANSMRSLLGNHPAKPGSGTGSGDQLSQLRASIDQTQGLLELLQNTNSEREKVLKISREIDRPSRSDGGGDSQCNRQTPPLPNASLPPNTNLKPIDVARSGNESPAPPLLGTPPRLKDHAPRVGNRFQPYASHSNSCAQPRQPYNPPAHSQPQVPFNRNVVGSRPYAPQPNRPLYQPPRPATHPYNTPYNIINPLANMGNNYRAARMQQRVFAEREMEIARGLVENFFRLQ